MNPNDLFDIIGRTPDRYVYDAEYNQEVHLKSVSPNRIILIAAIVGLILCLVGCAALYIFSLHDMKVGEYHFLIPPAYDEDGNLISVEPQTPITQISLQGANMEALSEWLSFTNTYDRQLEIAAQADAAVKSGDPWNIPDNYKSTYGCYSQEMVDQLNIIVNKYNLNLLSAYIPCEYYEGNVILGSLGLDRLIITDEVVDVQYGGGYFFLEGSFDIDMSLNLDAGDWMVKNSYCNYRYSLKAYFDPVAGAISSDMAYKQWNYTREDGKTVLLVLNADTARIFADLPDAFVSIHVTPVILSDGQEVPMTEEALEQMSELFDLSIKTKRANTKTVKQMKAESLAQHQAEKAAAIEERESNYGAGYQELVDYRLGTLLNPEDASYFLYDLNGDGNEELVINGYDVLSMSDGKSFKYFDITSVKIAGAAFYPCERNMFELSHELFAIHQYYYYQAGKDGATFITGLIHDTNEDVWYRSLTGGAYHEGREQITAEEAQRIRSTYNRIEIEQLPLSKYGKAVLSANYDDPYADYIAAKLDRYKNAVNYEYALYDVNGDGIEELITRDVEVRINGEEYILLSIHTVKDGKLWDMDMNYFTNVCEGGVLEASEDYTDEGDGSGYHYFYKCTADGVEPIEKIVRDPITRYWGHALAGQDGKTVTEVKARSILSSYKRLELSWKLFAEYPFS